MTKLEMTLPEAKKLYTGANEETRKWLEEKFGAIVFAPALYDKLTSWEKVCEHGGFDPIGILPYATPENGLQRFANACIKWAVISHVLRGGKKHDWTNGSKKWRGWWDLSSGSGLSYNGYDCAYTTASVGSRHCFATQEDLEHAVAYFPDVQRDLMLEED